MDEGLRYATNTVAVYMLVFPAVQLFTVLVLPGMLYRSYEYDPSIEGATYAFPLISVASTILSIPSFIGTLMMRGKELGIMVSSVVLVIWFFLTLSDSESSRMN